MSESFISDEDWQIIQSGINYEVDTEEKLRTEFERQHENTKDMVLKVSSAVVILRSANPGMAIFLEGLDKLIDWLSHSAVEVLFTWRQGKSTDPNSEVAEKETINYLLGLLKLFIKHEDQVRNRTVYRLENHLITRLSRRRARNSLKDLFEDIVKETLSFFNELYKEQSFKTHVIMWREYHRQKKARFSAVGEVSPHEPSITDHWTKDQFIGSSTKNSDALNTIRQMKSPVNALSAAENPAKLLQSKEFQKEYNLSEKAVQSLEDTVKTIQRLRKLENVFTILDVVESGDYKAALGNKKFLEAVMAKPGAAVLSSAFGAYQAGDPLGGGLAGWEIGSQFSVAAGWWGVAAGVVAGLFGQKKMNKWYRHKFEKADQAQEKPFFMGFDRGDRDIYNMPESYYFRSGRSGGSALGIGQLDDYIRESITSAYAAQLQRGLVF